MKLVKVSTNQKHGNNNDNEKKKMPETEFL